MGPLIQLPDGSWICPDRIVRIEAEDTEFEPPYLVVTMKDGSRIAIDADSWSWTDATEMLRLRWNAEKHDRFARTLVFAHAAVETLIREYPDAWRERIRRAMPGDPMSATSDGSSAAHLRELEARFLEFTATDGVTARPSLIDRLSAFWTRRRYRLRMATSVRS
jgi:hypothetical protein